MPKRQQTIDILIKHMMQITLRLPLQLMMTKKFDQSEGQERVSKQFLPLKDLDIVERFEGMFIESGVPIHFFDLARACIFC